MKSVDTDEMEMIEIEEVDEDIKESPEYSTNLQRLKDLSEGDEEMVLLNGEPITCSKLLFNTIKKHRPKVDDAFESY